MQWSNYQNDVFDAIANTSDSLSIDAVAGSGKTTTIVEAIKHVPADQSVCFLAFNRSIADELRSRVSSPNAVCKTLHSVGYAAWRNFLGNESRNLKLAISKTSDIMRAVMPYDARNKFGKNIGRMVSVAKGHGIVPADAMKLHKWEPLTDDSRDVWEGIIEHHELDRDECSIEWAQEILRHSIEASVGLIDFDDQLFMPIIGKAPFEKYDVIFVDEAQDLNSIQIEIVARMRTRWSRVIAVGDPHQAIYGFRGALHDSMDNIAARFKCVHLPLSVSYRCPKAVVKHAQEFVEHILPHESAPEGLVETPQKWGLKDLDRYDAVLCRNTRPLIGLAFLLIRNKISCQVLGKDIGQGLVNIIKKQKAGNIPELLERLRKYKAAEIAKMGDNQSRRGVLEDKLDTVQAFIDELGPGATVDDLIFNIDSLFSDRVGQVLSLATVHKSKGLEWERVFILDANLYMPSKWAKQKWQKQQEKNLQYVAVTRAKRELRYVTTEMLRSTTAHVELDETPGAPKKASGKAWAEVNNR